VFVWRKIIAPLDAVLQLSEEMEHREFTPSGSEQSSRCDSPMDAMSMTDSMVRLAGAVQPSGVPAVTPTDVRSLPKEMTPALE
jgi:hypothetical protein